MNDLTTFTQGSALHLLSLAVCLVATGITSVFALREQQIGRNAFHLREIIALGCVLSWILSNGFWLLPENFSWGQSLPLHFCNLANLVGAVAVLTRHRAAQSLMYFWAFGLCLWAFLTPSLYVGPALVWFWFFWLYHVFILISTVWILVADRFRPTWSDFRQSLFITLTYMALLAVLDFFADWNYGFVGPLTPTQANPLDFLGPYPMRLLWMALVGSAIFAILMIPWLRPRARSSE